MRTQSAHRLLLISLVLGIALGLALKICPAGFWRDTVLLNGVLYLLGNGFIALIKMMVVPLVFVSLICGLTAISDAGCMGKVAAKAIAFFLLTTAAAIILALTAGSIFQPGRGLDLSHLIEAPPTVAKGQALADVLLGMIPANPFLALSESNMLPIIVLALLVGLALNHLGNKAHHLAQWFAALNEINMIIVDWIMQLAPWGILALIATTVFSTGFEALISIAGFVALVSAVLLVHALLVYYLLLRFLANLSAKPFFRAFGQIAPLAFSTASSNACLPAALEMMDKLGVARQISAFILPIGATVNMNGTAIMQGVAVMFIAQIYGVTLSLNQLAMIVLTAVLAAIGTAGVPGVGLITLSMVLQSAGLPLEGIALIIGFDRILDMMRTTVNVMGDYICAVIIAKSENQLDLARYQAFGRR